MKLLTVALLGAAAVVDATDNSLELSWTTLDKEPSTMPYLAGVWESRSTEGSQDVVEAFSLTQGVPDSSGAAPLATWGSLSGKSVYTMTGYTMVGPVTGTVSPAGDSITWSHGYTSTLKSAKPIDLEGLWQIYETPDDGKTWTTGELCSVEQRGENVASFCEASLLHTYKLDGLTLKSMPAKGKGKEPDLTVASCGGLVYSKEAGFVGKRAMPPKTPKDDKAMPKLDAKPEHPTPGAGMTGIAPAWVRGEIEKPVEKKDMGGWTALVYSTEQQARLGVNSFGEAVNGLPVTMPGLAIVKAMIKTNLRG